MTQHAAAVSCHVARSRFAGWLTLGLWLLGALLALRAGWLTAQHTELGWRTLAIALGVLAAGAFAGWSWWRVPEGELQWDGQGWYWLHRNDRESGRPAVMLDLQRRVLMRWRADADDGAVRWFWLEASQATARWHELRCALHAQPAREPAAADSAPAAARNA